MISFEQIKDPVALNVLRVVRERNMDGYTLCSRTGLKPEQMAAALKELVERQLVVVKGATPEVFVKAVAPDAKLTGEDESLLLESYISVPLQAKGYADFLTGSMVS
jgi:hypothetical protein